MSVSDIISEMILNREKAKLAILKELERKDLSWLELTDIMREEYYKGEFNIYPFIKILTKKGLIEEKEGKCVIVDKTAVSKILSVNREEIKKILSMDFGKGDLAGQLTEQERYIFSKILTFGNSTRISDFCDSIFDDVDQGIGPFYGYARANYGKKRARTITTRLVERGFLKADGSLSIPPRILSDFLTEHVNELVSALKSVSEKTQNLLKKNNELSSKIKMLKTEIEKLDPKSALQSLTLPQSAKNYINKAIQRIDERSFSEAIMNCYRVSETLVKVLFNSLYPSLKDKRIKHEDKLKKIWSDEATEKRQFPGIRVIASLLSVILWYRNKMAAHTEMKPTKEAARISVNSLIQALIEFERLGFEINEE